MAQKSQGQGVEVQELQDRRNSVLITVTLIGRLIACRNMDGMNGTIWAALNLIRTVLEGLADGSFHPVMRSFGPVFIYRSMHGKPCLVLPRDLMILRSQNHESHQRIDQLGDGTIILKKLVNRLCFRTAE